MLNLLEVRVLGPFRVRAADGEPVDPRAWRTAKTRDLVRLLALSGGEPVPTSTLVDALWPTPDPARGRASLRTAASHVRQVLGEDHLVRTSGGLALVGAWVDASAFAGLARSAGHLLSAGDRASGVTTAWEAVNLYSGDLCEDSPCAEWACEERERYRGVLRGLLLDACEAAAELCWLRDASELAHRALLVDACAERAYRCLMSTYSRLGETGRALAVYERCRRYLADELGVDPAAETQALHLSLLRTPTVVLPAPPYVGHETALETVGAALESAATELRSVGIVVTGPAGSGRSRFVQQVLERWPHRSVEVPPSPATPGSPGGDGPRSVERAVDDHLSRSPRTPQSTGLAVAAPLLLVVEDLDRVCPEDLAALRRAMGRPSAPVAVLATAAQPPAAHAVPGSRRSWHHVPLPALPREQVAVLLERLLGGAPAAVLADDVFASTGGWPGAVVDAASALVRGGDLLSTSDGLVAAPAPRGRPAGREDARLAQARSQTGPAGGEVLDVLAVLNRPTSVGGLTRLTSQPVGELVSVLGQLTDYGVLTRVDGLVAFQDPVTREAAYRWLRRTVRDGLHRLVAETAELLPDVRVEHWLRCGEPALACAAALEAADAALARGDDCAARAQLLRVRAFASERVVDAADRIELDERLSDVAERLGRREEARTLVEEALVLARAHAPELLARLYRRLGRLAGTSVDALLAYEAVPEDGLDGRQKLSTALSVAALNLGTCPAGTWELLERAVEDADAADDVSAQVEARVLLSRAHAITRRFHEAETAARAALALAEASGSDPLFVRAAHAVVQTPSYLGAGLQVLGLIRRAWERSLASGDPAVIGEIGSTYGLVLHDLGNPAFDPTWKVVSAAVEGSGHARLHCLLEALFAVERGHLVQAERLLAAVPGGMDATVGDYAELMVVARLSEARGRLQGAVTALTGIVEDGRATTVTLLVPEAAARLAMLLAPLDPAAAENYLARAVSSAGEHLHPREHVSLLKARAALLAARGRPTEGATVALAAARAAGQAGLVRCEASALRQRELLLRAAVGSSVPRQPTGDALSVLQQTGPAAASLQVRSA